jgi:tetratricopeptide (TPR) repeat protein
MFPEPGHRSHNNPAILAWLASLVLAGLLLLLAFAGGIWARWQHNAASLLALSALHGNQKTTIQAAAGRLSQWGDDDCRSAWLLSQLYQGLGRTEEQDQAMLRAVQCAPGNIALVRAIAPDRLDLAAYAAGRHPEQAIAWFWLADLQSQEAPEIAVESYWRGLQLEPNEPRAWQALGNTLSRLGPERAARLYAELGLDQLAQSDQLWSIEAQFIFAHVIALEQPEQAIVLYRQALQRRPLDGLRWRELGDLLVENEPQAAIAAYLESCYNGDPGSHGCYNAGLTAEKLGDLPDAIRYYRLSKWSGALERAAALEAQLEGHLK